MPLLFSAKDVKSIFGRSLPVSLCLKHCVSEVLPTVLEALNNLPDQIQWPMASYVLDVMSVEVFPVTAVTFRQILTCLHPDFTVIFGISWVSRLYSNI